MKLLKLMPSAVAFAAASMMTVGAASARDLTIVGWGGTTQAAHKKAYFEPFMKDTGLNIIEDSWSGEMAKVRGMVETGKFSWDVIQTEAPDVLQGCEEGIFEPLDWSKITDRSNMVDGTALDCGVGVLIWSTVFTYDANKIKADGPKNWADFWNVDKWPGKRGLRRGAKISLEAALMADGVAVKDVYKVLSTKAGVDRAFKKLDELKPNILWWKAGAEPQERLAAGDVAMTTAYNAWVHKVNVKDGRNFKIVWDGNNYSIDYWTIVKGSPNKDKAYKFLASFVKPERQGVFFNDISYGWTVKNGVKEHIKPEMFPNLPTAGTNLDNALETNAEFWLDNGEELEKRFQAWMAK